MVLYKQSYRPDHDCVRISWSLLQVKLWLKTKHRLWPSQKRLQATVLTNAHQANLKNLIYWTRNKQMYFSLPVWWSNSWSLQTNRHWSTIWSRILQRRMKIVDQYLVPHRQTCFKYQRPGETLCICGSILQGTTEGVTKQAEQRINSRFIMYVPWRIFHGVDVFENLQRVPVTARSWSATSRTTSTVCACTNKDTRTPTWKNLT